MFNKFLISFILCLNFFHMIFGRLNSTHDSNVYNTTRVVGGSDIPEGSYVPYQVSLQYYTKKMEYKHFCGGSIIAADLILTAAHCCNGLKPERMSIVGGLRDLNDYGGFRSQVLSYEMHENYQELVTCDIAVLHIDPPLELDGRRMATVIVDSSEPVGAGVPVTLTGWGLRLPIPVPFLPPAWDTLNYPTTLQTMDYRTITNEQCRQSGMTDLTDTEICAQSFLNGACSGDSGGPLVMSTPNGLLQVGIVSYGLIVCGGFLSVPDVYTRVSMFSDWLQERMINSNATTENLKLVFLN